MGQMPDCVRPAFGKIVVLASCRRLSVTEESTINLKYAKSIFVNRTPSVFLNK